MEIRVSLQKSIEEKIICTGFKGVGEVGRLSLRYLLKSAERQEDAKRIGQALSHSQPPFVEIIETGIGNPYEFFEVGNLVLMNVRFPPSLKEQARLAETLTEEAKNQKARGFLLLGGLDQRIAKQVYKQDPLPIVGVSNMERPFLSRMNVPRAPQGILISGGVALILSYAFYLDIPALALFSPAEKDSTDRKSALRLAKKISDFFSLNLDFEGVEEEILLSRVAKEQRKEMAKDMKKQQEERLSDLFT